MSRDSEPLYEGSLSRSMRESLEEEGVDISKDFISAEIGLYASDNESVTFRNRESTRHLLKPWKTLEPYEQEFEDVNMDGVREVVNQYTR